MKRLFPLFLILASCASATRFTDKPMLQWDDDTRYAVEPANDGFVLVIEYAKHQFIPETEAIRSSCKESVTAIAHELAERDKRKLDKIDQSRIRVSTGRNGLSGVTSCSAMGRFFYSKH